MKNQTLMTELTLAKSLDETKGILKDHPELDAERVWQEISEHRSNKSEKLDLGELDSVSGGKDRDWVKQGYAATCEFSSWCWSNDLCAIWDVTYDNYWTKCPDGQDHIFKDSVCIRCGASKQMGDERNSRL